jgi:hypothetical protein
MHRTGPNRLDIHFNASLSRDDLDQRLACGQGAALGLPFCRNGGYRGYPDVA